MTIWHQSCFLKHYKAATDSYFDFSINPDEFAANDIVALSVSVDASRDTQELNNQIYLELSEYTDFDGDGVNDLYDTDDDADGVEDQFDVCPETPLGEAVDKVGCGYNTQQDNDQDGFYDISEACLNSPSSADRTLYETLVSEANGLIHQWGTNIDVSGCWLGELDRDNDNRRNYLDQCPDSPTNAIVDEFGCSMV